MKHYSNIAIVMLKCLFFGFVMSATIMVIRFWPLIFLKERQKDFAKNWDVNYMIVEWVFMSVAFSVFFSVSMYLENTTYLLTTLVSILFISLLVSYDYFMQPIMIILRKDKFKIAESYEKWAKDNINKDIVIRIQNQDDINAYATGILPFNKVILLSDKLMLSMNESDVKNLIYHEYAHLKLDHLLTLYLSNLLCWSIFTVSLIHFNPIFERTGSPALLISLYAGLFWSFRFLVVGLVQRKLEYQADKYAASIVGAASYAKTLENLNIVTNGGLEIKAINYPVLVDRIKYVTER